MKISLKRGFTLIELLIVIAIIATLAGVLLSQYGGVTESARATKCKSNLRNLAQAVQSYGMANGYYPPAGSFQTIGASIDTSSGRYDIGYDQKKGWVGWNCGDAYPATGNSPIQSSWTVSLSDQDNGRMAVTNGALWSYVGCNMDTYVCPTHVRLCQKAGFRPFWSYVMNGYFHYDWTKGSSSAGNADWLVAYDRDSSHVDKLLLFAEVPVVDVGAGDVSLQGSGGDPAYDGVLQYESKSWSGTSEYIGFNHTAGKRPTAHVVFADAHVETLALPSDVSKSALVELTTNLCLGADITFSGGQYKNAAKY